MKKKCTILCAFLVLMLSCITVQASAERLLSSNIYPLVHVVSQGFNRDGDYYTPKGRILWKINKDEFPIFSTLDEYVVLRPVSGKIVVFMMNGEQVLKTYEYALESTKYHSYVHLAVNWNISNVPRGRYALVSMSRVNGKSELISANALIID